MSAWALYHSGLVHSCMFLASWFEGGANRLNITKRERKVSLYVRGNKPNGCTKVKLSFWKGNTHEHNALLWH